MTTPANYPTPMHTLPHCPPNGAYPGGAGPYPQQPMQPTPTLSGVPPELLQTLAFAIIGVIGRIGASDGLGQPNTYGNAGGYGGGNPAFGGGNPAFGGGNPAFGGGNPAFGGGNPAFGGGNPAFGGGQAFGTSAAANQAAFNNGANLGDPFANLTNNLPSIDQLQQQFNQLGQTINNGPDFLNQPLNATNQQLMQGFDQLGQAINNNPFGGNFQG